LDQSFEPEEHYTAYDLNWGLWRRKYERGTVSAINRKRNGLRMMWIEKPLWQESKLNMQRQQFNKSRKIRQMLKIQD